jgi:2-dehydropantoate 2-reductase
MAVRIDCLGGGSIGLLLAGKLANAGATVTVVTRTEEQALSIQEKGLVVLETEGRLKVHPNAVSFNQYASSVAGQAEWILLTVKQKDITGELLAALNLHAGPETSVCCFQNGLGHLEKLRDAGLPARLYAAVTTEGARRTELHTVMHTGRGMTWIGEPGVYAAGEEHSPNPGRFTHLLETAGFFAKMSNFIDREIWNKLIMNAVINPVTALLKVHNGELLDSAETLELMSSLYKEAAQLAASLGVTLAEDLWERILAVCRATERNRSSMLQDVEAGRRTELEWLNGSLLRHGEALGLPMPVHRTVYLLVRSMEERSLRQPDGTKSF